MDTTNVNVFELENTDDGQFYQAVRHAIMSMLITVVMYMVSYVMVCKVKRPLVDQSSEDYAEAAVYRITIYLCSFTLSVSLAAGLLLPASIIGREVLRLLPNVYYVKWINGKLIRELWNGVFLCSNLSLFLLMPFAYFLIESEGFTGSKGIVARLKETCTVLVLLSFVTTGCSVIITRLFSWDTSTYTVSVLFNLIFTGHWCFSPWFLYSYLYSITSLIGVLMLLVLTPLGLARTFTVIGELVMKPQLAASLEEQINVLMLERQSLQCKLSSSPSVEWSSIAGARLGEIETQLSQLCKKKEMSPWRRNLMYPVVLVLVLFITTVSMGMVALNIFKLLLGYGPLPGVDEGFNEEFLDERYHSYMGSLGAVLEITLVSYILAASVIGFYTTTFFKRLIPRIGDTPLTLLISNCVVLLILSCSLPLLSATLGLTRFDLLGHFRTIDWLHNVHVVLIYNVLFEGLTALCLAKKVTTAVLREVCKQFAFLRPPAPVRARFYLHLSTILGYLSRV